MPIPMRHCVPGLLLPAILATLAGCADVSLAPGSANGAGGQGLTDGVTHDSGAQPAAVGLVDESIANCMLDSTYTFTRRDNPFIGAGDKLTLTSQGQLTYTKNIDYSHSFTCSVTLSNCNEPLHGERLALATELVDPTISSVFSRKDPQVWGLGAGGDGASLHVTRADVQLQDPECSTSLGLLPCDPTPQVVDDLAHDVAALAAWAQDVCSQASGDAGAGDPD
jgi:hypothetical protein